MHYDSSEKPWSGDPNAPRIPYNVYLWEKSNFSGVLISAILYGIVGVLFFQCMGALFNPKNRTRGGIRWGLVAYTTAAFSFVTIFTVTTLWMHSVSYIDDREFSDASDFSPPGPLGYQRLSYSNAISVVPDVVFLLNTWLNDGLLLYRCYLIYAMSYWIIAFPCLMYLASLAVGVTLIYYQVSQPDTREWSSVALSFNYPYFAISLSLNVFLTSMIVARLVLRDRHIRNAMGIPTGTRGLCNAIVTMLVESFSLYAISFLLFFGPWSADSPVENMFFPILVEIQVIAPFLIILRVANRRALTSDIILSRGVSSIHPSQGESAGGNGIIPDWHPTNSGDGCGKAPDKLAIEVEINVDEVSS